jgi:hypothetical protein
MGRDPARVDAELVALVRERTRAGDAEVRAALAPLSAAEEKALRKALARAGVALGPFGWADVARGVKVEVAAARELGGFYALQAERDALAAMVGKSEAPGSRLQAPGQVVEEPPVPEAPRRRHRAMPPPGPRAQELLGLFSYHRDAPLVARALRISLSELNDELDRLKIRRKAFRLTRGSDHDLPAASAVADAPSGPSVRRRKKRGAEPVAETPPPLSAKEQQARELKALLAEVGPRRSLLAARMGSPGEPLPETTLLARFRAAGLERELALRERDLVSALWTKHRASEGRVAAELGTDPAGLRRVARERGLTRELDALRDRLRKDARRKKWPQERIEQVLHKRDELRELGILEELDREVAVRTAVIWKTLSGRRDGLELLAKKLRLTRDDAVRLRRLLDLR